MNTNQSPSERDSTELQIGVENLRRMFRQTMAAQRREGESILEAKQRIAADPSTAKIAEMLGTTVPELLEGFGEPEVFIVPPEYDHAAATEAVDAVIQRVVDMPIGINDGVLARDRVDRAGRHEGALRAPSAGGPRRQVFGDAKVAQQVRAGMVRPMPMPRMPPKKAAAR